MDVEVLLVNAFTQAGSGGNPAGVVLQADNLSDAQKLAIAQAVGYSETAFVSSDHQVDFSLSFFTVTGEVDFCGHATLAAFYSLQRLGHLKAGRYQQRTKAGILSIELAPDGKVSMGQQLPRKLAVLAAQDIAELIGLHAQLLESTQLPIEVVSTGLPDILVAVPAGCLDRLQTDDHKISCFCREHNVVGLHVFELSTPESRFSASCRNFAPLFGISEESATGSSSGALACYLTEHTDRAGDFVFEQGRAMNCASTIMASVEKSGGSISSVKVGGFASSIGTMVVAV